MRFRTLVSRLLAGCGLACCVGMPLATAQFRLDPTVSGAQTVALFVTDNDVTYDLVVLTGATASVRPATNRAARVMFIDSNDDLVAVQLTSDATVTFSLESATGPAAPSKYNLTSQYMKGHASLAVINADATTTLKIWTYGRSTTANQALLRNDVVYDGIADLKSISIAAVTSGQFRLLDAANVRFTGTSGVVGIAAANVQFAEPVSVHEIEASGTGAPRLALGSTSEVRIMGGDLFQSNGAVVSVGGFPLLKLMDGVNSNGTVLPRQLLRGELQFADGAAASGPIAVSPLDVTFNAGTNGTYTPPVVGASNATFAVVGSGFPSWGTLNVATGAISGTPPSTLGSPFVFDLAITAGSTSARTVRVTLTVNGPSTTLPSFSLHPVGSNVSLGGSVTLSASAIGVPTPTYQWQLNGSPISGANTSSLNLSALTPAQAGCYTVVATNAAGSVESTAALIGVLSTAKVAGIAEEIGTDIKHANGNIYDQVLLQGAYGLIKADPGEITRISFIDPSHDIVQVEFSGTGTVSLFLEAPSAPAPPTFYNQSTNYVRGHARLVVTGADENTHLSVFSVGKANAVNQALFKPEVDYDGFADIVSISISSVNGKFGGLRTANAAYVGTSGFVGLYAPGIEFKGPVYMGDIAASNGATPVLTLGSTLDARITGGDLLQPNGRPVSVDGTFLLQFRDGSTSHGELLPAQSNRARFERNGADVTAQIVPQ